MLMLMHSHFRFLTGENVTYFEPWDCWRLIAKGCPRSLDPILLNKMGSDSRTDTSSEQRRKYFWSSLSVILMFTVDFTAIDRYKWRLQPRPIARFWARRPRWSTPRPRWPSRTRGPGSDGNRDPLQREKNVNLWSGLRIRVFWSDSYFKKAEAAFEESMIWIWFFPMSRRSGPGFILDNWLNCTF